jgi:hypothetical protein
MLPKVILTAVALALSSTTMAQSGRPCGLKIAPCPDGQTCIPNEDGCTNMDRCPGHCEFTNTYSSCGGHRIEPLDCDDAHECNDDPRKPESCGMACDVPGICIPKEQPKCGGYMEDGCPEGLACYDWPEEEYLARGEGCGVCL